MAFKCTYDSLWEQMDFIVVPLWMLMLLLFLFSNFVVASVAAWWSLKKLYYYFGIYLLTTAWFFILLSQCLNASKGNFVLHNNNNNSWAAFSDKPQAQNCTIQNKKRTEHERSNDPTDMRDDHIVADMLKYLPSFHELYDPWRIYLFKTYTSLVLQGATHAFIRWVNWMHSFFMHRTRNHRMFNILFSANLSHHYDRNSS